MTARSLAIPLLLAAFTPLVALSTLAFGFGIGGAVGPGGSNDLFAVGFGSAIMHHAP